jgi:hypothetical protein
MQEIAGGEIVVWAEDGGPIMLKVVQKYGDPVELAEHEAEELVSCLQNLISTIRQGDA